jgi:PAS domain S-box-containing protein
MSIKSTLSRTSDTENRRLILCRKFSQLLCLLVGVLGFVVILGWIVDLDSVKSILPNMATMKFNTALCFILSSLALYLLQTQRLNPHTSLIARTLAAIVLLFVTATLCQYLFNTNFHIDQLLVTDTDTLPENYPGRMSVGTALNFILVAVSLIALDTEVGKGRRPAQVLALLGILISGAAALGYLFGVTTFRLQIFSSMALNTAALFVIFGIATLLARPNSGIMQRAISDQIGGRMARIMIPVFTVLPIALGWLSFAGYEANYYSSEFSFALFCMLSILILGYFGTTGARILNAAEQQFTATFESAPTAMIVVNSRGKISMVNSLAETAFGYTRFELIGQSIESLIPSTYRESHPDLRAGYMQQPKALRAGEERELFGLRKDGTEFPVEIALNPITTGRETSVLSAITDISQRKAHELELKKRSADLARSNTDLEQFAYIASHDLQEPLRAVSGSVQLLENKYRDQLDDKAQEFIAHARDGTLRMQTLIEDLLAYSRLNKKDEGLEAVDCNQAFASALKNLQAAISESNAEVNCGNLPIIPGCASQMVLLFQNLIGNAIKFRHEGIAPIVKVKVEENNSEWLFSITDNGIGIEPQYFDRIFTIFQRLHLRHEYTGTGIGLTMCKRIIEQLGGKIWIESSIGKGAIFYFTVPK